MSVNIQNTTIISLKKFCQNPLRFLYNADNSIIAVCENDITIFYAITPKKLTEILEIKTTYKKANSISLDNKFNNLLVSKRLTVPLGKFAMYKDWQPDEDLQHCAAIWGIALYEPITAAELAAFVDYWKAEGKLFHHIQWQQKLVRSVYRKRSLKKKYHKDKSHLTDTLIRDFNIPYGFRGE
ncbi:primosomal protein DnaT [Candidatus Ishikawella capsulata]|nr:primosomal protein DnaT [Candidatus Ishikawaella capsulata]